MSDLIYRQAAIDALDGEIYSLTLFEKIQNIPPAQPEPRWIPVTERLPEAVGSYPVWTAKGFGDHLSTSYWDGESWTLRVVAWIPSPSSYEGE